jgi:hypothetical protein
MPGKPATSADHLKKAEENKRFGMGMVSTHPTAAGWALTAFFYSALHFTEAYLREVSVVTEKHSERTDVIKGRPELSKIYSHYRHLSDCGYNARYMFNVYGKRDIEQALPSLEAVERHIKTLLQPKSERL